MAGSELALAGHAGRARRWRPGRARRPPGRWRRRLASLGCVGRPCVDDLAGRANKPFSPSGWNSVDRYETSRARDRRLSRDIRRAVRGQNLLPPYDCAARSRAETSIPAVSMYSVVRTTRRPRRSRRRGHRHRKPCSQSRAAEGRGVDVRRCEHPGPHGRPRLGHSARCRGRCAHSTAAPLDRTVASKASA